MRVLVACEFSGRVREAFLRRGHDAYSCDYRMAWYSCDEGRHIMGDVRPLLRERWDLVIAHPPCTYLCLSSTGALKKQGEARRAKMRDGAEFFRECLGANADRVCVENPIPLGEAAALIGRKYDQIIHPWQFGHAQHKPTCLWLKGLPPLKATEVLKIGKGDRFNQELRWLSNTPQRGALRSITFVGIAEAMAGQWG